MTKKKKYEDYIRIFNNMSAAQKVPVLMTALDYMQQYNGRTRNDCIVYALAPSYDDAWNAINERDVRRLKP